MIEPTPETTADGSKRTAQIALATVTVLAIVGVAWLFLELTRFFLLVFAALVLAVIFDAMARRVTAVARVPRGPALGLSIIALLAVFIGAFALFGTQIAREFDTIVESIPPALAQVDALLSGFGVGESARELFARGSSDVSKLMSRAGGYVLAAGSGFADFVLVFVGAIFIASDPGVYRRGLLLLIPHRAEATLDKSLDDMSRGLRGWMVGQAASSALVAVLTWAGLAVLGVPAAGGLGLIAGLLDVIPMVGPIIAAVPAVLLAFTVSPMTALWTVGLFLVIQQLQGNFLQPMIQKQAVDVPPAVLLFSVVAAGTIFGFLGVLLAAPLTVVVYVMVQRIYVKTLLGKDVRVVGDR
ncbi:AI-2E family transporter [Sphingomonas psychrotolerans]|uniref:AI-2E family transporter n=1 Tax=Sphingomonas psychrotolerans TaxID=1327635 RepID=A0A2K8MEZ8_9SPHN|nr:AI-2E family transporter [Sphingomonas psychrotolerans]ATY31106.1 AI-2E family transporter [Sphingomonas psychrotolerans]